MKQLELESVKPDGNLSARILSTIAQGLLAEGANPPKKDLVERKVEKEKSGKPLVHLKDFYQFKCK